VSDTEETELAKQLQRLEEANREVSGDEGSDEEEEGMGGGEDVDELGDDLGAVKEINGKAAAVEEDAED